MILTLSQVAQNPQQYRYILESVGKEKMFLRPLEPTDEVGLTNLIEKLSKKTKKFYSYDKPAAGIAQEHREAINKYDKLRFVLQKAESKELIGLFEFSLDIPHDDIDRFKKYGINLSSATDCRIGPLLKDEYQSQGIGSSVMPMMINLAKQFDRSRIILWGGVFQDNPQAVRFYEKNGFKNIGQFENTDGISCYDMMLILN